MKFADPKNDVAFRKLFGNEKKKYILISFLNSVLDLKGRDQIKTISIKSNFQLPPIAGIKSSILDINVIDQNKNTYIVEMQVSEREAFAKRVQYYVSKEYAKQLKKGDNYAKLTPVVFIGILNFSYFACKEYLSQHIILNKRTFENELKDINFNFIELPKFKKKLKDCKTLVDKWIFFMKNAENLDVIPSDIDDKGLLEAYKELNQHNWSEDELSEYEYMIMRDFDSINEWNFAVRKATEELQQIAKESEEKIKESEEKRKESEEKIKESEEKRKESEEKVKRLEEKLILTAKKLLDSGVDVGIISQSTGLSVTEIKKLKKKG